MKHNFTYESALSAAEKINWKVEDLIGGDKQLDFAKPFLPESLARTEGLSFSMCSGRAFAGPISAPV
ncbi:MAG TPA: hypothetical protein VE398_25575 [Acidobacteriota bacterium]|nr:hypothetical protein [Acidobacteriota bacterium]